MPEPTTPREIVKAAVVSSISPLLLDWLRARCEVTYLPDAHQADLLKPAVAQSSILVVRSNVSVSAPVAQSMANLRILLRVGSGTDNLDLIALSERGVQVLRVGGEPSAPAVAELALQSAIALLRYVPAASAALTAGKWDKNAYTGQEICGSRVGIWGAGPIGRAVGAVFGQLGADVRFAAHQSVSSEIAVLRPADLCRTAAVHVFALPLRADTEHFVGNEWLRLLGRRAPHLVNVGRWELFDMPAVMSALERGQLSGAAIDPVETRHMAAMSNLLSASRESGQCLNLQLTPHLGAMTTSTQDRAARAAITALDMHWPVVFAQGRAN